MIDDTSQLQPDVAISTTGDLVRVHPTDLGPSQFFNRELSWLSFNARVLSVAADSNQPLLERVKFLAIYASNLDEFFQVRLAGLIDQVAGDVRRRTPDGRTPVTQVNDIRRGIESLERHRQQIWADDLLPALSENGVRISGYADLSPEDQKNADEYFDEQVFPILTPLAVDPGHPFPYISDLSLNLGVRVQRAGEDRIRFARIKIPNSLKRLVALQSTGVFIRIEDLIVAHLHQLFPGLDIVEHLLFRVTRNADLIYRDEEAEDLLELVEMELRRRRFGSAVRLEVGWGGAESIRSLLIRELELEDGDVYLESNFVAMSDLWALTSIDRPDLRYPDFAPIIPAAFAEGSGGGANVFAELRERDLLVHHPYESFAATVQEFIRQAADDPKVVAIKMTLYRTSSDSPIVRSLIRAVESGKQVAVLIELRARFDEKANIEWAKTLEQAGVHVTYGLAGLKVHSKLTMVVRRESGRMVRYCHFGTGNYNQGTAKVYGDFSLLTARAELGDQVAVLFNTLTGYAGDVEYPDLLVAPGTLRTGIERLIRNEMASENGRIIMKMNALVDPALIELLYEASQAGVQVDLVIRGICCLRPGVPGLSDNIRVRSIIGRYLEHARMFWFAHGRAEKVPALYIGSADLMPRNLDHRVEALVLITTPLLEAQLFHSLEADLSDSWQAWELDADGRWTQNRSPDLTDLHGNFEADAVTRRATAAANS